MRTFDQSRNIGHHELAFVADSDDSQVRVLRGEGVIRDLGCRPRKPTEECRLARVRFSNQADVGDDFQFENDVTFFARFSRPEFARGTIRGGHEPSVSFAPFARFGNDDPFTMFGQIFEHVTAGRIANNGTGRYANDFFFAHSARFERRLTGMPVFGMPVANADQMHEAADVFVRLNDDVPTTTAITTIGTTARNVSLTPKAARSRTPITRFTINADLIDEHIWIVAAIGTIE